MKIQIKQASGDYRLVVPRSVQTIVDHCAAMPDGELLTTMALVAACGVSRNAVHKVTTVEQLAPYQFREHTTRLLWGNQSTIDYVREHGLRG